MRPDPAGVDDDLGLDRTRIRHHTDDASVADRDLDDTFVSRTDTLSLRWLYSHMIEEYARHNGHADLIRQAIDGATGE